MKYYILIFLFGTINTLLAQQNLVTTRNIFSQQDSLRGSNTKERAWWDLIKYNLDIKINPADSSIVGSNKITYKVLKPYLNMQIDLQEPLVISKVEQEGAFLEFYRLGSAYFINLQSCQKIGSQKELTIYYNGKPKEAIKPPWDGGIVWKKERNGSYFIASACQGIGASVWWPNKDQMADEVDSMEISITAPSNLMSISNGRLVESTVLDNDTTTYKWLVTNPINNYGVNINIGDYTSFSEIFKGEKGILDCTYYVLKSNLEKAKTHFKEVPRMLKAFEYWLGPYPFYEDSYKLVEAPYLGMEHQSSVTYGNGFKNGYLGSDLSETGWGLKFDFIIIHESAHEWFANSITNKDVADMWIHESFASYAESLFVEYYYGKEAGATYVKGTRVNILKDKPIIGSYGVNKRGSNDMYFKGANMLHTLRQIVNNDAKWRKVLRGLSAQFYHQTVSTKQVEDYLSKSLDLNLKPFFDHYLRNTQIPTLEYNISNNVLKYRWINCESDFDMPIKLFFDTKEVWLKPSNNWIFKKLNKNISKIEIDSNFYINTKYSN